MKRYGFIDDYYDWWKDKILPWFKNPVFFIGAILITLSPLGIFIGLFLTLTIIGAIIGIPIMVISAAGLSIGLLLVIIAIAFRSK